MPSRTRVLVLRREPQQDPRPWLSWVILASLLLAGASAASNAYGQGGPTVPTTPAEIQPGHPASGKPAIVAPGKRGSVPQTAAPARLPPGASARNGVIAPPAVVGDRGIDKGAPNVGTMPVIPPPGVPGGNPRVVPK